MYLRSFPSSKINQFFEFIKVNKLIDEQTIRIHGTGGGVYKYHDLFEKEIFEPYKV